MVDFQTALEFIAKVKKSNSIDDLKIEFGKIIKDLGFNTFSCVSYVDFGAPPEGAVVIVEYPEHFYDRYKEKHFEEHDRILKTALKQSTPFIWSNEPVKKGMTQVEKQVFSEAADVDMIQGVTIPIHMRGAYPGSVNVVGDNVDINPEVVSIIHLMGVYLHNAALRHFQKDLKRKRLMSDLLTDKERECLRWVAVGKTDWEIGEIISRSENTIHFHIENAKKKLNAPTRVQAVIAAYMQDQILP